MGERWEPGDRKQPPGLNVRRKTLRRFALPLVGGALLVVSLTSAVRRSESGRALSGELDQLEEDVLILRDRVATQSARADSLASLPRMEAVGNDLGLRQAEDGEVFHLSEPMAESAVEREAPDGRGPGGGR